MKITELSIGNYVRNTDGEAVLIYLIKLDEHMGVEEVLVSSEKGITNYAEWLEVKELQPIPITTEFWQKNGFEDVGSKSVVNYCYTKDNILIDVYREDDSWICNVFEQNRIEINSFPISMSKIKYVHQLQNFLRLNEIELEIKVRKSQKRRKTLLKKRWKW